MSYLKKYENKKIAIYGMGRTGCSAAKTFNKLKAIVYCWDDDKKVQKKIKNLNLPLKKFWLDRCSIHRILISPGIDINRCKIKKYLKKNFNKIITDLDLFFELNKNATIISITGTNGKSTTCKIIEKILKTAKYKVKTVGNIGNPVLYLNPSEKKNIFILETSSYQLQYSKLFRSKHAAILNISPDHLERHKNIKNYIKVKSRIFMAQNNSDYSYINSKNKYTNLIKKIFKVKKLKSKLILVNKNSCNFLLKEINNEYFKSKGNAENLAFAYQIIKNFNIKKSVIINALNKFKGLSHRQEIVYLDKKLLCVNDSKATGFDASLQSLTSYNKIYWIVGGLPKKKDSFDLKNVSKNIAKAYIIGKNSSFFTKQLKNIIPISLSYNLKNAVSNIFYDLKKDKNSKSTILLSPAAASFDQFDSFEDRGEHFKILIKKMIQRFSNV